MCMGSRRGSSDSYYRELGDQETLKIEDKSGSDDAEEETSLCCAHETPRLSPHSCPGASSWTSPQPSRQASPRTSPQSSRQASPQTSPQTSRQTSSRTSPRPSRNASPQPGPSRLRSPRATTKTQVSPRTSPRPSRNASPQPGPSRLRSPRATTKTHVSPQTSPRPSRNASPQPGPSGLRSPRATTKTQVSPKTTPQTSPQTSPKTSPPSSGRISPKITRESTPESSLDLTLSSPRRPQWKYPRMSWLYLISSDIQSDAMEEIDSERHELRERKAAFRFLTMHKRRRKKLVTRCLGTEQALLDDMLYGQVQCILNKSFDWKFNAFALETVSGGRCLPVLCVHLFQSYGLLSHFHLDAAKMWKLFCLIEEGYHSSNPYHNSIHAADVTQAMHCFLQQNRIRAHMTPLEIMASLLAAIAHDMDHPGVNQPFLIATSNHLATLYQNTSVLENHHWRSAMSCLIESGILDQLEIPDIRDKLETHISSLILATDITRQQEYLTNFKNHLDKDTLDMTKSEHRLLVLQIALKCADISNPCRSWDISEKWSHKVCEEFFRQGDYERRLNLPITALCDRRNNTIPKIQTGFFKFVVTPLITEWHRFLENDLSHQMLCNLLYNQHKWESLVVQEEEADTEISDAELETDNESESARLLQPPRRASLNPIMKKSSTNEPHRRFSVPLNVFQDIMLKKREKKTRTLVEKRTLPSQPDTSPRTQPGPRGHCSRSAEAEADVLNSDHLLRDSTIASITTPDQATRLNAVFKESALVRQQPIPTLASTSSEPPVVSRPPCYEESATVSYYRPDIPRPVPEVAKKDSRYSYLATRDTKKTDTDDTDTSVEFEPPRKEKSGRKLSRRESSAVGSQLRDNLTSMPLELGSDPLLQRRRKSMPADVLPFAPREKKIREVPTTLPQFLRRTFSGKESWSKRRGSAPSPVAPSELRGLASLGSLRHSVNGGRRKPSLTLTCQQWLAKATYGVQEHTLQQFPRRSSLPVEAFQPTNTGDDT